MPVKNIFEKKNENSFLGEKKKKVSIGPSHFSSKISVYNFCINADPFSIIFCKI